jgi:hypothetical protein
MASYETEDLAGCFNQFVFYMIALGFALGVSFALTTWAIISLIKILGGF